MRNIYTVIIIELSHVLYSKTQFFHTLKFLKSGLVLHFMVSKNRSLKVKMRLKKVDNFQFFAVDIVNIHNKC